MRYERVYDRVKQTGGFRSNNGALYRRIPGKDRLWIVLDRELFKMSVRFLFRSYEQSTILDSVLNAVYKGLKADPDIQILFADQEPEYRHLIYLNNGVFDSKLKRIVPLGSINIDFRYALDFSYLPKRDIQSATFFWRFLYSSLGADTFTVERLLQVICCVVTGCKTKTAYMFFGKSNSGKSVLSELIRSVFVPRSTVTSVPLEKFSDNFMLASLSQSFLNICSEVSEGCFKKGVVASFKQITSRETISVSFKYEDSFPARFHTTLLLCSNVMPKISEDNLEPVLNRLEVVVFPFSIPPKYQDHMLLEKLLEERDIIFSCALDRLSTVEENNYILQETYLSNEFKQEYWRNSKVYLLQEFLKHFCVREDKSFIPTAVLYHAFMVFVNCNGLGEGMSVADFSKYIKRCPDIKWTRRRVNGHHIRGFMGLSLNEDARFFISQSKTSLRFPLEALTDQGKEEERIVSSEKALLFSKGNTDPVFYSIAKQHEHAVRNGYYIGEHPEEKNAVPVFIPVDKMDTADSFWNTEDTGISV